MSEHAMTLSLRDFDRPADRIRQHRQADQRPVIVVEGPSDARLFREGFDGEYVPFSVGTRAKALEVTRQLSLWTTPRFACVVDRDFDGEVAAGEADGLPIHAYENADLEAMISKSEAFRLMMLELGSEQKLEAFGGLLALVQALEKVVAPLARLRAASAFFGWGLVFDKVDLSDKIELRTLNLKLRSYCVALAAKSQDPPDIQTLMACADGSQPLEHSPSCPRGSKPYYRGRDYLAAAGVALRQRIGSCEKAATRVDHLAGVIRAIFCPLIRHSAWAKDLPVLLEAK